MAGSNKNTTMIMELKQENYVRAMYNNKDS